MAFNITVKDDKIILKLSGNVDLSETNDIKAAIVEEPKVGFKYLAINGESLEYIDSSGVALMLFTKKLASEQNLIFEVETLSENAQKVINLAGLSSILKVKNVAKGEAASSPSKTADDGLDLSFDNLFDDLTEDTKSNNDIKIKPGSF
jgi:anti-sigma B factor antagonist